MFNFKKLYLANSYINSNLDSLGLTNNNVGNIRPLSVGQWEGQIGVNRNFVVFQDLAWGIRAFATNFYSSVTRHGTDTLAKYLNRYAPESDNNITSSYITSVSNATGINPNAKMPTDVKSVKSILKAQMRVELGSYADYVTDADIDEGFSLLSSPVASFFSAAGIFYKTHKKTINYAVIGAVIIGMTAYIYFLKKRGIIGHWK